MVTTLVVTIAALAFCGGVEVAQAAHHDQTVCIVVHPNGAPAPASCSNPDAYQVNN